jgi:predicted DsbA family dithiol-disulfide isomerase
MHGKIFGAGGEFDEDDLVRFAEELGLDMNQFEEDRHSDEIEDRIRKVRLEGARSGVNGTPTFFLDNWRIDVAPTHEHLAAYVDHFHAHMNE